MTDRAVSVTVNYVLGLAIITVLLTGLIWAAGDIVGDRQDAAARSEMQVVGQQVVAELMTADRLAQTGAETVVVVVEARADIARMDYTISLDGPAEEVVLMTTDQTIVVRIPFDTRTAVTSSTADGGEVELFLNPSGELEVRAA